MNPVKIAVGFLSLALLAADGSSWDTLTAAQTQAALKTVRVLELWTNGDVHRCVAYSIVDDAAVKSAVLEKFAAVCLNHPSR